MYSPPVSRRIVGFNGAAATVDDSPHSIRHGQPILVQHGWLTANNTKPILIPEVAQHPPPMHHAAGGSGGGNHQMVAMSQFEREVAPSNQPGGGQQPAGVAALKDRRVVGAKIVGRNSPELVWWSEALKRKEHIRLTQQQQQQQQQQSGGHPITLLLHAQSSKIGREQLEVWCAKANKKQTTDVDGSKAYRVYVRCIGKRPTTIKRQAIEVTTSSRKKNKQQREQQEEVLEPGCSTEIRNGDVVQLAEDEAPFELQGGCCCEDVVMSSDAPSGARKRGAEKDTRDKASHSFGGSHHPPQGIVMEEIPISTLDGDSLDKMDAALQRLADAPPPSDDVQRMTRVHPEVAAKESDADDMALLLGAAAAPEERKGTPQRHPTPPPVQAPTTSGQTTRAPQQPAVVAAVVEEGDDDMALLLKSGPPPPAVAATKPPTERQPTPAAGGDEEVTVVVATAAPPEALTTSTARGKKSKNKKEAGSKRGRKSTAKQAQAQAPPPTEQVEGDDHSKKKKKATSPPNNKGASSSFGVVVAADVEDQLPPSNSSASKKKEAHAPPPAYDTGDMSDIFVVSDDDVVGHGMEALSRSVTPQRKNDVASELLPVAVVEEEPERVVGGKKKATPNQNDNEAFGKSNTEVELEAQVAAITAQISADVPPAAPPALLAAQPNKQHHHVSVSDDEEDESLLQFYKRKRLEEAQQEKNQAKVKTFEATKNAAVPVVVENEEKKSCSTAKTASGKTKGKAPKAAKKSSASKSKKKTAHPAVTVASGSPAKKHVTVVTPLQQPSDPLQPSGSGTPPPPVARTLHMSQVTQDPPAEPIDENDVLDSSNLHDVVVVAAVTEGEENGDQQVPESPQVATTGPPPPPSGGARPSFSAAPSSTSAARPRPSDGSDGDVENGGAATQTQQQSQQQRQQRNIVTSKARQQQQHEAVIADVEEDEGESQSIVELQRSVVVMSQQFPPQEEEEETSAIVEAVEEEDDSAESQDSLVKGLVGGSHQKKPQQRVAEPGSSKTKTNTASRMTGRETNQQDTLESTQLARSTSKQTTTTTSKAHTQQQVGRSETPTTSKVDRSLSGASSARSSVSMQNKESQYFMLNGDRIHIPAAMSTGKKAPNNNKQKSFSQRESQLDGKGSTSARSPVPPNHDNGSSRVDSQYTSLDALMAMIDSQNSQGGVEQDTALLGVALAKHHADNTNNSMLPQRSATMPPVTLTNHTTHGAFLSSANPPSVPLSGNGPSAGSGPPLKNYAMMPPLSTATGGSNGSGALPLSRRQTSGSHGARYGFLNNNAQQQQQRGAPAAPTSAAAMVDSQVVFFDHGDDF